MILPVFVESFLHIAQVISRIGIKIAVRKFSRTFRLVSRLSLARSMSPASRSMKSFFGFGQIADAGHVDRDDADGAGQGIRAEKAAAAHVELAVVDAQAAAHAARIFGIHVGIDEIGKVRHAVFRGHLPQVGHIGIVPVEIPRDAVGGNREGENPSPGVAFRHDLQKRLVEQIEFLLEFTIGFLLGLPPIITC